MDQKKKKDEEIGGREIPFFTISASTPPVPFVRSLKLIVGYSVPKKGHRRINEALTV